MHTWTWKNASDRDVAPTNQHTYLTCSLLDSWSHGFFTHAWWPTPPTDITPVLDPNAIGYRVKQVHGNVVLTPTDVEAHQAELETHSNPASEPFPFPDADGLRSETGGQALWVASADCTPALIADPVTGTVAAVHAGWRGTVQQIIPVAIRQMHDQGSQLRDIRVALGPAIAGDVYQVSTTVAAQVVQTIVSDRPVTASLTAKEVARVLEQAQTLDNPPVLPDAQAGRVRLDVRRVNQLQLEALGLTDAQVAIAPYCTFQSPELFFSYRRERLKKVQWSGIVSR